MIEFYPLLRKSLLFALEIQTCNFVIRCVYLDIVFYIGTLCNSFCMLIKEGIFVLYFFLYKPIMKSIFRTNIPKCCCRSDRSL